MVFGRFSTTGLLGRFCLLLFTCGANGLPSSGAGLSRFETAEIGFARDRLVREAGGDVGKDPDIIRKAYRKLALRLNQHLYGKKESLEFQMRMLNLAKDALVKGEKISAEDDFETGSSGEHVEEGRQLMPGKRLSEDIFKSMMGWQEESIEKGVRFDDPRDEDFPGNTQLEFDAALDAILSDPLHPVHAPFWKHVEGQGRKLSDSSRRAIERRLHLALQACGLEELVEETSFVANAKKGFVSREVIEGLHRIASVHWDGRAYSCDGEVETESTDGVNRRSKACSPCGKLIAEQPELKSKLLAFARDLQMDQIVDDDVADRKGALAALKEKLSGDAQLKDPFCKERKNNVYEAITKEFGDYRFAKAVDLAYPLEPCALLGLEQFVAEKKLTHRTTRSRANFTESEAAGQDRKLVEGLSGLLGLQNAKYSIGTRSRSDAELLQPEKLKKSKSFRHTRRERKQRSKVRAEDLSGSEKMSSDERLKRAALVQREQDAEDKKFFYKRHLTCRSRDRLKQKKVSKSMSSKEKLGGEESDSLLLDSLRELEEVVWQGTGFPELHEQAAKAVADLASTLQLQRVLLDDNLESLGNLEPIYDPPTEAVFPHLSFPGLSLRPYMAYERGLLREWGAVGTYEKEENSEIEYDPVKIALGYLDLVPYCDMQSQIVGSFLQAAFWFWRSLQGIEENCGEALEGWVAEFLIPDLETAPKEVQQVALVYALKKATLEMLDTASQIAEHLTSPAIRYLMIRTALRIRWTLLHEYGAAEDVPKLVESFLKYRKLQRSQPLWHPPAIMIGDVLFADVLTSRLQEAFLSMTRGLSPLVAPLSTEDIVGIKYETDLIQMSYDLQGSRYSAMETALDAFASQSESNAVSDVRSRGAESEVFFRQIEANLKPAFLDSYFDRHGYFSVGEHHEGKNRLRKVAESRFGEQYEEGTEDIFASSNEDAEESSNFAAETEGVETVRDGKSRLKKHETESARFSKHRLTGSFLEDGEAFSHIEGLEFDLESGHLYLLGGQNALDREPLIDAEDVAMLLTTVKSGEPALVTLDPIAPFHVFQKVTSNLRDLGPKHTKVEATMKFLG